MGALPAQIGVVSDAIDERGAYRRSLRLAVGAVLPNDTVNALIHNISELGLLVETGAELRIGEQLFVDLPHVGETGAVVVWAGGSFFGCEFAPAVSRAAVSAALLRSPVEREIQTAKSLSTLRSEGLIDKAIEPPESQVLLGAALLLSVIIVLVFLISMASLPLSMT